MRIHLALAILTLAAAAPVHAQRGQPVHRGDGYEIVLPAKCRPMPTNEARSFMSNKDAETRLMAAGEKTVVMVMRAGFDEFQDTTMATRRAMLHLARAGMLQSSGEVEVVGEPRDFERDDRVGVRVSVTMPQEDVKGVTIHGTAELSVPRQGDAVIWIVVVFDERSDAATRAEMERVLDSFRVTEVASVAAEKGSAAAGRGFVEATDLAAKP